MKKTIAKIMSAVMLLSAVPAVALPTMTAKAATTVVVYRGKDTSEVGDIYSEPGTKNVGTSWWGGEFGRIEPTTGSSVGDTIEFIAGGEAKEFISKVTCEYDKDDEDSKWGWIEVTTKGDAKAFAKAVKEGENTFTVTATFKSGVNVVDGDAIDKESQESDETATEPAVTGTEETSEDAQVNADGNDSSMGMSINYEELGEEYKYTDSSLFIGTYRLGGEAEIADGKTEILDWSASTKEIDDALWPDDEDSPYIKVTMNSAGELTVGKSTDLDIKNCDALRGQTLPLNEFNVGGFSCPVTKISGQALKEAHMKKVVAENVKSVGKGAFRKCKQVKKIDLSDSNKVRKIHSKAFYGDRNLNTVIIDGRKLKTVGADAFSGVKKNCNIKIKAKKSKFDADVKLIEKSGAKNVKYTRVAP